MMVMTMEQTMMVMTMEQTMMTMTMEQTMMTMTMEQTMMTMTMEQTMMVMTMEQTEMKEKATQDKTIQMNLRIAQLLAEEPGVMSAADTHVQAQASLPPTACDEDPKGRA